MVTSPGHPGQYSSSYDCLWLAQVPPGYRVKIAFTVFNVEV